jgi:hypothetical protein
MNKLLVSIEIRCGEYEFTKKDVITFPKGLSEEDAITQHYSTDATNVDGDSYYYDGDAYCYTVNSWIKLNPKQEKILDGLGIR